MNPLCRLVCCLAAAACVTASGCALYTPVKVWRWTFDYNTEREFGFQVEAYDHLPPRPIRMRMTKWAYNVGPSPSPGMMFIPEGAPMTPQDSPAPTLPPAPAPDQLDNARPPALPPEPASTLTPLTPRSGPSAFRSRNMRSISYQNSVAPDPNPTPATAAWLFSTR
ncbi:MAG TPA: hypothetical protein VM165_14810 [Planctomycetaceae bacterium]|nr:hypothetical protein [Planctomycetaceae bacterium]